MTKMQLRNPFGLFSFIALATVLVSSDYFSLWSCVPSPSPFPFIVTLKVAGLWEGWRWGQ